MVRNASKRLALLAGFLILFVPTQVAAGDRLEHVPVILAISCSIQKSQPPNLTVAVLGQVPTAGWSAPQVAPRIYVAPPTDRIWEYDFLAKPPSGPVDQVLSEISARHTWKGYPAEQIDGLRVFGVAAGIQEVKLSECESQVRSFETETSASGNICGSYPNCSSSACWNGKKCQCKKDDKSKVCSPFSCISDKNCK